MTSMRDPREPGALSKFAAEMYAEGLEIERRMVGLADKPIEQRLGFKIDAILYRMKVVMNVGTLHQREQVLDHVNGLFNLYLDALETPVNPQTVVETN